MNIGVTLEEKTQRCLWNWGILLEINLEDFLRKQSIWKDLDEQTKTQGGRYELWPAHVFFFGVSFRSLRSCLFIYGGWFGFPTSCFLLAWSCLPSTTLLTDCSELLTTANRENQMAVRNTFSNHYHGKKCFSAILLFLPEPLKVHDFERYKSANTFLKSRVQLVNIMLE